MLKKNFVFLFTGLVFLNWTSLLAQSNPPPTVTLTVNGGEGSGTYTNGELVVISADAPGANETFDRWTGDTQHVESVTSSITTVIMPTNDIILTATYVNVYTLTVNSGTGNGSYTNGARVVIAADAPGSGQAFDRWIDDTQYVASVTSSTTTVIMPAQDVSLTATYVDIYTLTVNNGTGNGSYTNGTRVVITADAPGPGKTFDRWTGDTQYAASLTSSTTTVIMPAQDISLTATYADVYYTLTVTNGTGDGSYTNGTLVSIAADAPGPGKAFDRWTGDTQHVASVTSSNTTVTMPTNHISLSATYVNVYTLTVNNGTGDGSYTNGARVVITADAPGSGKGFDRWTGDTQYVTNVTSSITTVTMPTNHVILTATYVNVYTLTVNSGTGDGSYSNGARVVITADEHEGEVFYRWTGAIQYLESVISSPAIVTMPPWAITLTPAYVADTNLPTIKIKSPTMAQRIIESNGSFTVSGTAADNRSVVDVLVKLNTNDYESADTTNQWKNWEFPVELIPGTNTIMAYSVDSAANTSLIATGMCIYGMKATLTIRTNGSGRVSLSPDGPMETGKTYTLKASAKSGSCFLNWTGDMPATNRTIMFTMDTNKTVIANFLDIQEPTIRITAPTASQRCLSTNGLFIVKGTAADNTTLSNVLVKLNDTSWTNAGTTNGWKNWNIPVMLNTGTNTILAYGIDTTGNCSPTSGVKCVHVETGTLIIITNGPGKVKIAPTGLPELGETYKLTASPAAGSVFTNWTGDINSTNRVVTFIMTSNKTFTANFIDLQKPTVKITYPTASMNVMTNGTVVLRGTAADNGRLDRVMHQLYTGEWTNAVTTNVWKNWSATYSPVIGLNTAKVYSVDVQGYVSATSTVVFTYIPGAVMTVQTNGMGTVSPAYNGKVLQIGSTNTMTATAKPGHVFTNWTCGIGGAVATNTRIISFVMQSNLILTANFRSLTNPAPAAVSEKMPPQAAITVDGSADDWTGIPRTAFSYASMTQEVAAALSGNNIVLLLNGCPFDVSDTVLVYFKLRLSYRDGDDRHTVDLWTSGSVLYGMIDGEAVSGLEAVLSGGVLEVKLPVDQAPAQVTLDEVACGMDLGDGTLTELFRIVSPWKILVLEKP